MADNRILSEENLSTITAVTFVLALVSLAFNFFLFSRQNELAILTTSLDVTLNERNIAERGQLTARIDELQAQVDALREAAAAPAEPGDAPQD